MGVSARLVDVIYSAVTVMLQKGRGWPRGLSSESGRVAGLVAGACSRLGGAWGWRVVFWMPLRRTPSQSSALSVPGLSLIHI